MFHIEDETHAEPQSGTFNSFEEALNELKRRSTIPWDEEPNRAPCINWQTCERNYQIVEYDNSSIPWQELQRVDALRISAKGIEWKIER